MSKNGFFALISRMRHITRWGLMRNSSRENVQEHSHSVAVLAHALLLSATGSLGKITTPTGPPSSPFTTTPPK